MQGILLILALAVTVEAVVEYVKSIVKMFTEKDYRTAITQLSAAAIAIALCFAAGADLYAALGLRFAAPWIGTALTGLFASRGANYVSDLIASCRPWAKSRDKKRNHPGVSAPGRLSLLFGLPVRGSVGGRRGGGRRIGRPCLPAAPAAAQP